MRVYRLETPEGEGIYGVGYGFKCAKSSLVYEATGAYPPQDEHPSPIDDPLLKDFWGKPHWSQNKQIEWNLNGVREWICGFSSEEQMLDWFPPQGFSKMVQMDNRLNKGVRVSIYEVHGRQVKQGKYQALFRRQDATLVATIPLEMFSS
jgi:hypothetical protein